MALLSLARKKSRRTDTNLERSTASDKEGYFEIPSIPPGNYRVEGDTGFQKFVRSGLRLEINQKMEIPVTLGATGACGRLFCHRRQPIAGNNNVFA